MKLATYKTKELADELSKREGVIRQVAGPHQDLSLEINGPAIVLIIKD